MMSDFVFYLIICGILLYAFFKWAKLNDNYFDIRNIKHFEPKFLIGNTTGLFFKRYAPRDFMQMLYNRFPKEKLIGFFDMREPVYLARDIELIRRLTIKDFDNFEDRVAFIDSESDKLFGKSLILLNGKKWHDMRATLSPAFTGSKMRHMFELVVECAENMAKYLIEEGKLNSPIRWEMKDLFSRYTSDVIATCAFGLKVDSLKDRSNEFFIIGKESVNFASLKLGLRIFLIRLMPKLMRILDFGVFSKHIRSFFKSMVLDTMQEREQRKIYRPDMINLLMQVRKGELKHQHDETNMESTGFATVEESHIGKKQVNRTWTDDEIVAQCFVFFFAGFDTASTLMSFLFYELALNQDIQDKLYEEVKKINSELNGAQLSYDTLSKLKYLDQVISEGLRKWPPAVIISRKCTKDHEYDLDGKKIYIERGRPIWIPVYPIHHDPTLYEHPEIFDPERFNDENKQKIKHGQYLPFGIGPRNCIGSRFALMEMKALLFYLILNFNIQPYEKTQIPLKIGKSMLNWTTENGIHLELRPRTQDKHSI